MKKFLLCMVLAGLMMPVVAQEKLSAEKVRLSDVTRSDFGISSSPMLPLNPTGGAIIEVSPWVTAGKSESYDRQTQGIVCPMSCVHDDGRFIGAVWTNEDNPPFEGSSVAKRGVAYTYSEDGGATWAAVNLRVGGIPLYWPSYAQWGVNGEAILARSADDHTYQGVHILNGLVLLTRENRGVGEWSLHPLPYPEKTPYGTPENYIMAWSRMVTSGDDHQYIQIITHTRGGEGTGCDGYYEPPFYYRTTDGETWDVAGKLLPDEVVGEKFDHEDFDPSFTDKISFSANGNVIAASFIPFPYHDYILKSVDNGDTWTITKFFHTNVSWNISPAEYSDSCYVPVCGDIAVDNEGRVHVAFANQWVFNSDNDEEIMWRRGYLNSFLSYWNDDMDPLTSDDLNWIDVEELMFDKFIDDDLSLEEQLYIKSTTPEWPIIGFYVPTGDPNLFTVAGDQSLDWAYDSYSTQGYHQGLFGFPQMAFDKDNKLHLAYLGLLDGGEQDGRWLRHPFHTSRNADGTWTETKYLVNTIDLVDYEFAYLVCAGMKDDYHMHLMAQVDPFAGTFEPYAGHTPDQSAISNSFMFSFVADVAIKEVERTSLTMNVIPNPASGQATVNFEGKGNVTVYNMLGQAVYHVENVENTKTISLNNMTTGVYFVTVRSGNATATQKLIVQ